MQDVSQAGATEQAIVTEIYAPEDGSHRGLGLGIRVQGLGFKV